MTIGTTGRTSENYWNDEAWTIEIFKRQSRCREESNNDLNQRENGVWNSSTYVLLRLQWNESQKMKILR